MAGLNGAGAAREAKGPWHGPKAVAAIVAEPRAEADSRTVPVSGYGLYLCSYEDIVDGCDGFFKVSGLDTDDDVELG